MKPTRLVWLDVETTGLDVERDALLEVYVVVAPFEAPLATAETYHAVFAFNGTIESSFVRAMHTRNDLLKACLDSCLTYEQADRELVERFCVGTTDDLVLAGSSIHFDHGFVKRFLPGFASRLSHRHFDVSAIKLACVSLGMPEIPKAEAHRAREDVTESIGHFRKCAEWILNGRG